MNVERLTTKSREVVSAAIATATQRGHATVEVWHLLLALLDTGDSTAPALLRAVGASRAQVRSLVWLEASMIGVMAAVLGVGIGTAMGRVGAGLALGTLGGSPVVPWLALLAVALVAVITAWAVSLGVARRASRVPPAEAGKI